MKTEKPVKSEPVSSNRNGSAKYQITAHKAGYKSAAEFNFVRRYGGD